MAFPLADEKVNATFSFVVAFEGAVTVGGVLTPTESAMLWDADNPSPVSVIFTASVSEPTKFEAGVYLRPFKAVIKLGIVPLMVIDGELFAPAIRAIEPGEPNNRLPWPTVNAT